MPGRSQANFPTFSFETDFPPLPITQKSIDTPTSIANNEVSNFASSSLNLSQIKFCENDIITNIPMEMIQNQFGMLGLYKLCHDNSPFKELMCNQIVLGSRDIKYDVPIEYQLHRWIPKEALKDPPLCKLSDETLFWVFYNCCQEEAQMVAAKEL